MRNYYMLFCKEPDGSWFAQFGDYTKKSVQQEERDTYVKDYPKGNRLILKLEDDSDRAFREAEAKLNPHKQHDEHMWSYANTFDKLR